MISEDAALNEYKIWRKNVPLIYDLVYTNTLKHPTPCIQWFPDVQRVDNQKSVQRILTTTFSNGSAPKEELMISQITFPDLVDEDSLNNADITLKTCQSIPLAVDANKCKLCPLATNLIACKTSSPEILIFDYTKHSSFNSRKPADTALKGHSQGGFAIDWNSMRFGHLASGGNDKLVNIFDINCGLISSLKVHSDVVNDIHYSKFNPDIFCSVGDDLRICVNDSRNPSSSLIVEKGHHSTIESCSFSPFKSELLATGSSDTSIKIWDIRSLDHPVYVLRSHKNKVISVKWSPHYESLLASCSSDTRVIIWDLNKINSHDLFIHGGHTHLVDDIDWNPAEPMEIASVSCDGALQVWKVPLEKYV